jgi:tetratricopeptide (TPR) repeat protein/tRNA A-37 threonylcarbamoyl transferase component Bud32
VNTQRWQRIGVIFDKVAEAAPAARDDLLKLLCGDDAELKRDVDALLLADQGQAVFEHAVNAAQVALAAAWSQPHAAPATIAANTRIGPWSVLQELGRGGMGMVLLVERADGQFEQRAALKLIKRGMDSETLLARFLRERQILARLEHPHIARLLDGGITDEGRPYFAMEYINGQPLLLHCAAQKLGLEQRIKLFVDICAAAQFAHRALIVHLDLKSSNVLVTDDGVVKLLDFGIAKLLADDIDTTQTGDAAGRPLTPAHAAPEQLCGEPISTATDVYALGAILYELLTGQRPYDFGIATTLGEIRNQLNSTPPPLPSNRASADAPVPARRLRGDLDTIILTALKREPDRRYATADALAQDLHRYLLGEPIHARRDSAWYRTTKFVLRHRLSVVMASVAIFGLIATTALALWEARLARAQAQRAETVTDFLIDIFRVADPKGAPGGVQLSAVDVLDAGAQRLDTQLSSQPQLAARFGEVMGAIYIELGQYEHAIRLLQEALGKLADTGADSSAANLTGQLARAEYEKGDYVAAEKNAAAALAQHGSSDGANSASVAHDLALQGEIARRQGDFKKADPLLRQALAMSRANLNSPNAQIAAQLNQLAVLYSDMRRLDEGTTLTEAALAMFTALYGENHLDVAENLTNLGSFRMQAGHVAEALPPLQQAITIYRRLLPADHPLLATALANHARAFDRLGRFDEAEPLYLQALAMQRRVLGEQHPDVAATLNNLAVLHMHHDDFVAGADYSRQALAIWVAQGKPEHPFALGSKANLSVALRESGDLPESERLIREVLSERRKQLGEKHFLVSYTMDQLGIVLRLSDRPAEAIIQHQIAQDMRADASGLPSQEVAASHLHFALSELAVADLGAANQQIRQALQILDKLQPSNTERLADALLAQARIALAQHDVPAGCTAANHALELRPADDPAHGWRHAEALAVHGACLAAHNNFVAARSEIKTALIQLQRARGSDHWMTLQVRTALQRVPEH